jgi:hypothetical protein
MAEQQKRYKEAMDYYAKFIKNDKLPEVGMIRKRMNDIYLIMSDSAGKK